MAALREAEIQDEIQQDMAVTKIQAIHRGNSQRRKIETKKSADVDADMFALDSSDEDNAEVLMMSQPSSHPKSSSDTDLEVKTTTAAQPDSTEQKPGPKQDKPERKMSKMGSLLLNAHRGGDLEKAVVNMEEEMAADDDIDSSPNNDDNAADAAEDEFLGLGSSGARGDESTQPDGSENERMDFNVAGGDESVPPSKQELGQDLTLDAAMAAKATSDVDSSTEELSDEELAVRNEARSELSEIRRVVQDSGGANIDTDNLTQDEAAKQASKELAEMTAGLNTSSDEEDGFEAHPALEGTEEDAREALREELRKLETEITMV